VNVLSLFDGMSCGMLALDRLGIKVDKYYASEIDKYAMQVSAANYPEIIQVGDVCDLKSEDFKDIDLILAGSPCQGFSLAGKQLAFDDPRSALFFEFIRLLKEIKPKYFLLENVRMKKEFLQIISEQVSACYPEITFGIDPIFINSSLVSAQSRPRYYWTNIPGIEQPKERGIVLKDILEPDAEEPMYSNIYGGFGEKKPREHYGKSVTIRANSGGGSIPNIKLKDLSKYYLSEKAIAYMNRSSPKWSNGKTRKDIYIKREDQKGDCLTANMHKGVPYGIVEIKAGAFRARPLDKNGKRVVWKDVKPKQILETRKDEKSNSITSVQKDNVLTKDEVYWRKLTPIECERLQTVPDNYTNHVSNTQRYKMLGNGWTIEVIAHILKGMKV
jgi:DNA (cytosine-5)-methyltransferase 3A